MKKTPLKRNKGLVQKTPLKAKTGLKAKTPLKAKKGLDSYSTLKTHKPLQAKTPLKAKKPLQAKTELKTKTPLKPSENYQLKRTPIKKKAKPKIERYSIIFSPLNKCCLCGASEANGKHIELHEIFFGTSNRDKSIADGMVAPLCEECHRGTRGVHNFRETDLKLKKIGQSKWEEEYGDRDAFIKRFGQSWL